MSTATATATDDHLFPREGDLARLPDRDLLALSGRLGRDRRQIDRRFLATLVEIDRRGLLRARMRAMSIEEYGSKVGGVSPQTVTDLVNLGRTFAAYPRSWALFASGAIGWTLLRTVAPMLATRSDAEWSTLLVRGTKASLARMVQAWRAAAASVAQPEAQPRGSAEVLPGKDSCPPNTASRADAAGGRAVGTGGLGNEGLTPGPDAAPAGLASATDLAARPQLSAALLARLEARRQALEAKLGRPLDLEGLVAALLDATEPRPSDAPAVPCRVLAGASVDGFVEVRVREVSTGRVLRRTRQGWAEVSDVVVALTLREGDPGLDGDALYAAAVASAARARGREAPPLVERWVWLRSGGACEVPSCGRRGRHIHHRTRRAQGLDHHPDRLTLVCDACHAALHAGLLTDDGLPVEALGSSPLAWPDRAAVARRLASRDAVG